MKKNLAALPILFVALIVPGCVPPVPPPEAARPFPAHTVYAAGTLKVGNHTQAELDDAVREAYARWKDRYVRDATRIGGDTAYRIKAARANSAPTVSEGQGYGMIIVALMAGDDPDAYEIFNGLWQFVNDHPSTIDDRLMDFKIPASGVPLPDGDAAFDGDADIAYGLLLAEAQWGAESDMDYHAGALRVLAGIMESMIGPDSRLPMLGDWEDPAGDPYNQYTPRPSDFMPAHFRAFARATGDATWNAVAQACQDAVTAVQAAHSPETGLMPDFLVPVSAADHTLQPAPPFFLEEASDGDYKYNSGRVPWRIATDFLLNGNATSRAQAQRITRWAATATGGDPLLIAPGYHLDGTPIPPADYWTSFFAAPIGVAAMAAPEQQDWLDAIFDAVKNSDEEYYEDTVSLLCLLAMTNNYWDPTV